jgi:hypothetical protein
LIVLLTLPLLLAVLASPLVARAANPTNGALGWADSSTSWIGTASGSGSADESTCVEGVNCDSYSLTVTGTPAEWHVANKGIRINIDWAVAANDYDLYIHKDSLTGPLVTNSGNGAPSTRESAVIDPSASGVGTYVVHVVYFAGTPQADQPHGAAIVTQLPKAIYLKGGFTFSQPRALSAPGTVRDGEPSSRCDKFGNYYIAGIRGVPAGVDMWYFNVNPNSPFYDPYLRLPGYRGQPDSFTGEASTSVGADGGGDVDLAVGFPQSGTPLLAFSSLTIANISTAVSSDRGLTWQRNPLGNVNGGVPVDDRQWMEFLGDHVCYLFYRTFQPAVSIVQRSEDGGYTWGPPRTAGQIGQAGDIAIDQNDGTVYITGSDGKIAVGIPNTFTGEPTTYTVHQVAPGGSANLFIVCKVAPNGTVYVCYSDGFNIYLTYSLNKGLVWSEPVRVSDGPETATSLLPWMEVGPTPGSVAIVWYGTSGVNDDSARWQLFFAQSLDATATSPTFTQTQVLPYSVHGANISLGGTLGNANRNLLDYFQICFAPDGSALIAYTDDHNDFDGATYVTHQIGGPTVNGGKMNGSPVEGVAMSRPRQRSRSGPQVFDPDQDVAVLTGTAPLTDPTDVQQIYYSSNNGVITATMTVSQLASIPVSTTWRMHFTANAPEMGIGPNFDFSYGISDQGDQFWIKAATSAQGVPAYTWGTAVRNGDGTLTYTQRGTATGSIDIASRTVSVSVPVSALNAFVTHGPPIAAGSPICGLRGSAFDNIKSDDTRGGSQFWVR